MQYFISQTCLKQESTGGTWTSSPVLGGEVNRTDLWENYCGCCHLCLPRGFIVPGYVTGLSRHARPGARPLELACWTCKGWGPSL